MPVLTANIPTKRIVLPASSKPDDEAYVEVAEEVLMDVMYDIDLELPQMVVAVQVLAKIIKNWNFTDESGAKAPITPENVRLLPMADIAFISQESGLESKFKTLSKQKKSQS